MHLISPYALACALVSFDLRKRFIFHFAVRLSFAPRFYCQAQRSATNDFESAQNSVTVLAVLNIELSHEFDQHKQSCTSGR